MYNISVPVYNSTLDKIGRENILKQMKRFDAKRVFLALGTYEFDTEKRKQALLELSENCKFFKDNGFEVGAWIWTFMTKENDMFTNMRTISGDEAKTYMCPTDKKFVEFAKDYIKDVAKCGVDIIQFDDDFRYGFLIKNQPACLCDNHIFEINRITNSQLTREEIEKHITHGSKNIYRDAYLKVNKDTFENFAKEVRKTVDEVNPKIRVGACACMSSWDVDGTDAYTLATILAGNTKPFVRLIGAPYWGAKNAWGNSLSDVIELERMESAWTKKGEIEIIAEGDAYPRPRKHCPASFLEGFDTAIRVSGATDGILKYGIDYLSNADYETGYARFHERNKETYKKIDEMFLGKKSVGVRVYESMKKISDMKMPTKVNDDVNIQNLFFSKAARTLCYNTIPTVYEGDGVCGIVFDENARNLPKEALKNGLIIDIAAAEILTERGIDTGLEKIESQIVAGGAMTQNECFKTDGNRIHLSGTVFYDIKVNEKANVLSTTITREGKTVPMSYTYENDNGNKFLVLNINTRKDADNILKHYSRSRQYADVIEYLSGKKLPAYTYGNPSMYIQCKKDENSMAVGLWNFFCDVAIDTVVELDKEYSEIKFLNCEGKLEGDRVYLSDIVPYAFCAFEVK